MIIRRTNGKSPAAHADECFAAAQRHHERKPATSAAALAGPTDAAQTQVPGSEAGDIIFGAKAIAFFIFGDDGNRARRRVFNLWAHYSGRKERAGFFKLKGALCLSKAQWRTFHGLG